jgi:hypothetical protein
LAFVAAGSTRRFDERREADLAFALVGRPDAHLFAALPLNGNSCDQTGPVFHGVGELVVAAIELDAADAADVIGGFQRRDEFVGIGRAAGALDRLGDDIDHVVGRIADIGWRDAVLLHVGLGEWDRHRGERDVGGGSRSGNHAFGRAVGIFPEGAGGGLRALTDHRHRHLLVVPLHRRLHADMADAGHDHVRVLVLDLMEDRREVVGVRVEADMVQHLQSRFGEAFEIAFIEWRGPGGILAHDHGGLHVHGIDQQVLGVIADRLGDERRREPAVERVLVMVVVVVDGLGDQIAGGAGRDERHVQPRRPGLERQHHLADIAADDGDDLVLADGALEGAHRVGRRGVIVVSDHLNLAAVNTAVGIDVIGGHGRGLGQRRAGDGGFFADHADLDRIGRLRRCGYRRKRDRKPGASGKPGTRSAHYALHGHPPIVRETLRLPRSCAALPQVVVRL